MLSRQAHKIRQIFFALLIISVLLWTGRGLAATEISNVRYWAAPDHTRVVFDLSGEPDYRYSISDNILVLEFNDAFFIKTLAQEMPIDKPGISRIVFTKNDGAFCRAELFLTEYFKVEVFKLKKFMGKPDRVVVDIILQQAVDEAVLPEPPPEALKKRVIVIDPGHGGEDPGAIGRNGTYEKHVVLAISREIKKEIDKMPGYRAILTRDGDYYVSFKNRLDTARRANADLFISVHADAARNRQARGSSVYCLSTRGASNEAARLLANNENLSDIIGGVPNGESSNQSDEIVLNMFQTHTINMSKTYASDLLDQLGRVHCLKYPVFHEAPFRVLKLLDIPAILLETAYISNAEEEMLLKKTSFRKTIAQAVAASVGNFFGITTAGAAIAGSPMPPGNISVRAAKRQNTPETVQTSLYSVRRGDNLSAIARKHGTSLQVLLDLNKMKMNDKLLVGRKIIVPVPGVPPSAVPQKQLKKYKVKDGDTLFSLARSCSITVDELRRLNNMSENDVLLSGSRINLPE